MIKKYNKKPVTIEAVQWTGSNKQEILDFVGDAAVFKTIPPAASRDYISETCLFINTLEGEMSAIPSDMIIKGVNGEFYPCKIDIFNKTYEEIA